MATKDQSIEDAPEAAAEEQDRLKEVREAYESAAGELKEAADRLRTEIKNIDMEKVGDSAKTWVKENPGLAFFLAVGTGMLVGRAITKALEPPPPPSLTNRARMRAQDLGESVRHFAGDTADRFSRHAYEAGEQVADRLRDAREVVHDRRGALSDIISRRAGNLSSSASDRAGELVSSFSDAAERAADSLQLAAKDLSKTLKKRRKAPENFLDALSHAAKTVFGAFIFKRLSDWIRER